MIKLVVLDKVAPNDIKSTTVPMIDIPRKYETFCARENSPAQEQHTHQDDEVKTDKDGESIAGLHGDQDDSIQYDKGINTKETLMTNQEKFIGTTWLLSANGTHYDHEASFQRNGFIDWRQYNRHFEVGDRVFIYCTRPIARVRFLAKVEKINMEPKDIIDDSEFWSNKKKPVITDDTYVRLRLIKTVDNAKLDLAHMRANGLGLKRNGRPKDPPQGGANIVNEQLNKYLTGIFGI